ncbi:hypothetical protein BU16DRAFT_555717 [Lophium mytilinum]|uniref:Uncharacterized protein n=1 Tax=Lophium mytilinum TaxID=390894 RepID=A0A6A6RBT9_9PEZI|nr:hypothetical protein BU16DRAFT_555717 [Lophium mytilinum]
MASPTAGQAAGLRRLGRQQENEEEMHDAAGSRKDSYSVPCAPATPANGAARCDEEGGNGLDCLAGLVNTLVSVYTAQNRQWSITAKVTVCVTGSCTLIMGLLFVAYNDLVLSRVKRKHEREMQLNETDEHEDILHTINRKAHEPALDPSSVV